MQTNQCNRAIATIEEVAETFGIARSTAYDLAKRDALPVPVIRLGRRLMVSRRALDHLFASDANRSESEAQDRVAV
jgi:predicted DNA-binding transcriptional regulator AlpA